MISSFLAAIALVLPPAPGALNPAVRPDTINTTICVSGWSAKVRPPVSYTAAIKRRLLQDQQLPGTVGGYQLDHEVSISLGGATRSLRNLWMQPQSQASTDDRLEARWHRLVCHGTWELRYAQRVELRWKRAHG